MTYQMLGSWGYSGSRISVAVLVSGVWNTFAKLALPVLALALLALQGNASGARVTLAIAGIATLVAAIVVFALLLRSAQLAERFGLLAGRVASRLLGLIRRPAVLRELATARVPHPDPGAAGAGLGAHHRRHPGQPPVAVPGAARSACARWGQRCRGLPGRRCWWRSRSCG